MILIVTNKTDYTADFLILGLKERGVGFFRFNTEEFPKTIELILDISNNNIEGQLKAHNRVIDLAEIQSVWYRRPVASDPSEKIQGEAEREYIITESRETLEGLWRILHGFWVSHPDNLRAAESKLYQLKVASDLGFAIPQTLVTNSPAVAEAFYRTHSNQIICKPQRQGQISRRENVSLIYTNMVEEQHTEHFSSVQFAPVLFQPYVPKAIEIRVTVVGLRVFAVELHSQEVEHARFDWRRVDASELHHQAHRLPLDIETKCISLVRTLGLSFGAIDLILTPESEYVFLEINPNGQWAWIQQLCPDIHIREALIDLLISGGR